VHAGRGRRGRQPHRLAVVPQGEHGRLPGADAVTGATGPVGVRRRPLLPESRGPGVAGHAGATLPGAHATQHVHRPDAQPQERGRPRTACPHQETAPHPRGPTTGTRATAATSRNARTPGPIPTTPRPERDAHGGGPMNGCAAPTSASSRCTATACSSPTSNRTARPTTPTGSKAASMPTSNASSSPPRPERRTHQTVLRMGRLHEKRRPRPGTVRHPRMLEEAHNEPRTRTRTSPRNMDPSATAHQRTRHPRNRIRHPKRLGRTPMTRRIRHTFCHLTQNYIIELLPNFQHSTLQLFFFVFI